MKHGFIKVAAATPRVTVAAVSYTHLKYRLETQQEDSGVRHLIVDEMQDYSRIQYLIIQKLFKCKMTILGDREQTMDGDQQDVLTFLPKIFGKDIRRIVMNKSYRNTIAVSYTHLFFFIVLVLLMIIFCDQGISAIYCFSRFRVSSFV